MENSINNLPKNVQKLIKRMADIQRKEIALLHSGVESGKPPKDVGKKMDEFFEMGNKAISELMSTQFATIEMGVGWDEDDDLATSMHQFGVYFLSLYSLERMSLEIAGEKPDEDLFYAGTFLLHRAMLLEDALENDEDDEEPDDMGDVDSMLDSLFDAFGDMTEPGKSGKVVPLFVEKKDKKDKKK